jgi:hypothetical protein
MAKTRLLRDALATDLDTIATLLEIAVEPKKASLLAIPGAMLAPGEGGQGERATMAPSHGGGIQIFVVDLVHRSNTPHDAIMDLLDEVRNTVEVGTSTLSSVSGVETVDVISWEPTLTSEDIANQLAHIRVHIEVVYLYSKGSL